MHETHEHNTKIYSCSVCGVRVESIWAARSHFRESHSEKPLYCHLCQNSFSSMIQVHHHLSTHHPDLVGTIVDNQAGEFKCIFCGKTMNSGMYCSCLSFENTFFVDFLNVRLGKSDGVELIVYILSL